ncbi:hypothetical protein [Haliea sp. E17]|uniref:hypothetical protein n=1 Tax=Haliea sp. E17 TaxID=3401576 RepID=UPI003AAE2C1D
MAEYAFDTLHHARSLKAAGVPEQQAEVHAELMGKAFAYITGELVTRDYLDMQLAKLEARQDTHFAELRAQLRMHNWIFAVLTAAIVLPTIRDFLVP